MMYVRLVYEEPKCVRDEKKSSLDLYHVCIVSFFVLIVLYYYIIV